MAAKENQVSREERRRLERFDLEAPTKIEVQIGAGRRDVLSLMTRDISSRGAYVNTRQPLEEGVSVKLELLLSVEMLQRFVGARGKARVRVKGKVVRVDENGMAIQFDRKYVISASGNGLDNQ